MPLPAANPWGTPPVYGVLNEGDDSQDATQDSDCVGGNRINQMSADIIALYEGESSRRGYATVLTAAEVLGAAAHDKVYTNTGAGGGVGARVVTLPSAADCKRVSFYDDGTGFRIAANAGQTIRTAPGPANITKTAGYIESSAEGAFISLVRISANKWIAAAIVGDWAVEIS